MRRQQPEQKAAILGRCRLFVGYSLERLNEFCFPFSQVRRSTTGTLAGNF
jgi:hypothetical protein